MRLDVPTQRWGLREVAVRPGLIDDVVRELFGWGQCHLLACALHELTGWPFGLVEQQLRLDRPWKWCHVTVLPPHHAPLVLDVEGLRDFGAVQAGYAWIGPGLMRLRRIDDLAGLHHEFGLAKDTPATWWQSTVTGQGGISLIRSFAAALLNGVPGDAAQVA